MSNKDKTKIKFIVDANSIVETDFENAKKMVSSNQYSLVVLKDNQAFAFNDSGVKRLLSLLQQKDILKDSTVCDKVVGKAAAALMVLGGVKKVYALVISQLGLTFLNENNIMVEYDNLTQRITNRTGDGFCPMEQAVLNAKDANSAFLLLQQKLLQLAGKTL